MSVKIIISSRKNLQSKYGNKFSDIEQKLKALIVSDKKRNIETRIVFIDDTASARSARIKPVKALTERACKESVDALFQKHIPAYIALLGAQDVFPFQEIANPAEDDDVAVLSDLPYACDAPYSKNIDGFTGPTRVVGRIPDIPNVADSRYLLRLLQNSIHNKPRKLEAYEKYFAVSAQVWRKSTELSLQNMFGTSAGLLLSPPSDAEYSKTELKPLTHFYNCHGAAADHRYYGQRGDHYPEALWASNLQKNISKGTIVAAECCYGAELVDPELLETPAVNGKKILSVANTYLGNDALAFVGSSTIAYGPADSQGLADLITQYFIKSVLCSASTGRAFLEARQKFLTVCAPHLDPYELKTLAQFYLLGDPSAQPVQPEEEKSALALSNTTANNRINLSNKGLSLQRTVVPSKKQAKAKPSKNNEELKQILKTTRFKQDVKELVYEVKPDTQKLVGMEKKLMGEKARFRTFIAPEKSVRNRVYEYRVLVVKENDEQILGWRVYESKQ